jgi:hypothetical protein
LVLVQVIYRVTGHSVLIFLIADGRRNMNTLLAPAPARRAGQQ